MKIGVLGTGMVGQAIGGKLVALGHEVRLGSRDAKNEKAAAWAKGAGRERVARDLCRFCFLRRIGLQLHVGRGRARRRSIGW